MLTKPEAEPVEGYVWCDFDGSVHSDEPNPFGIPCDREEPGHNPLACVEDQSGNHYVCPGPHKPMYKLDL